jgi:hypothetical protein
VQNTIAVRRYGLDQSRCVDTLYWLAPDSYRLHKTSDHPDEKPSEWEILDAWRAGDWLADCPEQIYPPNGPSSASIARQIKRAAKRAMEAAGQVSAE